jgi:hypothetical protein
MTIGIIPFIATWLILAVLICWFAGGQTSRFGHQSIQQDCFPQKYHSPIQIRPPPMTACAFKSLFYYDVFLITNQRAISIMLTAFFICTFLLIVFDMLILGRNAPVLSLFYAAHTIFLIQFRSSILSGK